MRPPPHFYRPLSAVLRESLLGTLNGRAAIAVSVVCVALAGLWQLLHSFLGVELPVDLRMLLFAPLFLFLLFVLWPPAPNEVGPSAIRWLFLGIVLVAPALLEVVK